MLIISQDKERIFNLQNIEFIEIAEDKKSIHCRCENIIYFLGNYTTNERAKEVLQEIVTKYLEYVKTGGRFDYKALNNTTEHYYSLPKVYEMPEE